VNQEKVSVWLDRRWGPAGIWAWAFLAGWLAAIRGFFIILYAPSKIWIAKIIGAPIILFMIIVGAASLFTQWPKVAYKVVAINNATYSVFCYFFRKLEYRLDEIARIDVFKIIGIRSWLTPLKVSGENYRITLKSGKWFCLSGHMVDVETLVNLYHESSGLIVTNVSMKEVFSR